MTRYCTECEYPEPVFRSGLCEAHYKRKRLGHTVSGEIKKPESGRGRLREAAHRYSDASDTDEAEYERADDNLSKSAIAYTLSLPAYHRLVQLAGLKPTGHHSARRIRRVSRWMQLELWVDKPGK